MNVRKVLRSLVFTITACISLPLAFQTFSSVPIQENEELYAVLSQAQMRGMCTLPGTRPYLETAVKSAINDILAASDQAADSGDKKNVLSETEEKILYAYLDRYARKEGLDAARGGYYHEDDTLFHNSFDVTAGLETSASGGVYFDGNGQWGMDVVPKIDIMGDLGNIFSYNFFIFGDISRSVLTQNQTTYKIGYYWYDGVTSTKIYTTPRYINTYSNTAFLPFSYHKKWDGSVYKLADLSASGLEGWSDDLALGFGINAEMTASFLDNHVYFRFGRIYHEWAAMDEGSSLVLNMNAHPFMAFEQVYHPWKWFTLSSMLGVLEFPNAAYVYAGAYTASSTDHNYFNDAYADVFQNGYSNTMIEADFRYMHADFGTSVIMPKRFDLGYMFPLMDKVIYQNDQGDYDNINLFGDLKFQYPGIGNVWCSLFLDEFNGLSRTSGLLGDVGHHTRNMYATQAGVKLVIPWLPFATFAMRYTKVEPYCYTHQAINYTPWYDYYISEAYLNAGESIGYYLPPNADETRIDIEAMPRADVTAHLTYLFIR